MIVYEVFQRGKSKGFLLGTCHVGRPEQHEEKQLLISQLLEGAEILGVESIDSHGPDFFTQGPGGRALGYDGHSTVAEQLSLEELANLQAHAERLGFRVYPEARCAWQLMLLYANVELAYSSGMSPEEGDEKFLEGTASRNGIDAVPLEDGESSLAIFRELGKLTPQNIDQAFGFSREQLVEFCSRSCSAASLQDVTAAMALLPAECMMTAVLGLEARNRLQAKTAGILYRGYGKSVCAVGALHLAGASGVIALLEKQGFTLIAK